MDEMKIMEHLSFNGNEFVGFVDLGREGGCEDEVPASDALVFMLVALNNNWKIPCGYFLISSLDSSGI